jgi:uncharacterized delta-60 repeat protein
MKRKIFYAWIATVVIIGQFVFISSYSEAYAQDQVVPSSVKAFNKEPLSNPNNGAIGQNQSYSSQYTNKNLFSRRIRQRNISEIENVSLLHSTRQTLDLKNDLLRIQINETVADSISEAWMRHIDHAYITRENGATAIAVDVYGNVYVTGYVVVNQDDSHSYVTVKYSSSGVQQWVSFYGGGIFYARAIAVDAIGNVYVTGEGNSILVTNYNYVTIKYDANGIQKWVADYNGPANADDYANALAIDVLGNVYVTGESYASSTGYDYATIKYDSSGTQKWAVRYNGTGNFHDYANALTLDASGNVYVTGESAGSIYSDYATIKYNSSGVQQWVARYNGPGSTYDGASAISLDASGNIYVTGYSSGTNTDIDYATIKYNSSGTQQWVSRYNGPGNLDDYSNALAVDALGNVYVTGESNSSGNYFDYDYATIEYNTSGVQQWVTRYNGPGNYADRASALGLDASGNVYVTGFSYGLSNNYDYATIKYNTSGAQQWVARYTQSGRDYARAIAIDASGNVYVTGESYGTIMNEFTTIKYVQVTVSVEEKSVGLPQLFSLYQNYPNPFNPSTTISFDLPTKSFVSLRVFDVIGREVALIVSKELPAGSYSRTWNANYLASGIYFYRLQTGSFIQTKKMLFLK